MAKMTLNSLTYIKFKLKTIFRYLDNNWIVVLTFLQFLYNIIYYVQYLRSGAYMVKMTLNSITHIQFKLKTIFFRYLDNSKVINASFHLN